MGWPALLSLALVGAVWTGSRMDSFLYVSKDQTEKSDLIMRTAGVDESQRRSTHSFKKWLAERVEGDQRTEWMNRRMSVRR